MKKKSGRVKATLEKFRNSESLKARVARGGIWLGAGSGFEQLFRLVRNMILTRILAPEAFGIMAIVLAVNAAFESMTQIGVREAIVQNPKGRESTYLNGAWWLAFGRAVVLYAIVYALAPWVSRFYENPEIVPLMRVAFLSLLFNGLMSSKAYVAIKDMKFKRWVMVFHGGGVFGIATAVFLAFAVKNVWALVIGFAVEAAARCILSYFVCPFYPRFRFDKTNLGSLFKFARGMFGLPILTFIFMRADIFVVGKLCTKSELGLYSMAGHLAWLPLNFVTMLISQIMLPAFSERQTERTWINERTLYITSLIAFMGFPLLCFLVFYGESLLKLIYGERYGTVSIPFAIIFGLAVIRTCSVPIAAVYLASGRPELHRLFTGIRAILIIALIYPAVKWFGLIGAASAGLISMLIGYFLQVKRMRAVTGLNLQSYISIFFNALCISSSVVIFWILTRSFFSFPGTADMIPGVIGCLLAYGIGIKFFLRSKAIKES